MKIQDDILMIAESMNEKTEAKQFKSISEELDAVAQICAEDDEYKIPRTAYSWYCKTIAIMDNGEKKTYHALYLQDEFQLKEDAIAEFIDDLLRIDGVVSYENVDVKHVPMTDIADEPFIATELSETDKINERSGQDGITPIAHPKTQNRTTKAPEYYVVVDQYRIAIPDYDSKFVMQNLQFTDGVTVTDFNRAFKTTDPKRAIEFLETVIKRYPTFNVALLRDNWSWAPVSFGGSNQRRPGTIDIWVADGKYWQRDAKYLKMMDRSHAFNEAETAETGISHDPDEIKTVETCAQKISECPDEDKAAILMALCYILADSKFDSHILDKERPYEFSQEQHDAWDAMRDFIAIGHRVYYNLD